MIVSKLITLTNSGETKLVKEALILTARRVRQQLAFCKKANINLKKYMFINLLQILFIGLKLTNFIDWNWFLVLSPYLLITLIILSPFIYSFVLKIISILKKQSSGRGK